jgi:hypothetical protein
MDREREIPMDRRTMLQGQIRELLQGSLRCLDEIEASELIPASAMTLAKSLEYAAQTAGKLADWHVSICHRPPCAPRTAFSECPNQD